MHYFLQTNLQSLMFNHAFVYLNEALIMLSNLLFVIVRLSLTLSTVKMPVTSQSSLRDGSKILQKVLYPELQYTFTQVNALIKSVTMLCQPIHAYLI